MLRKDPTLWEVPIQNMDRWLQNGTESLGYQKWREILRKMSRKEIMKLLVSRSQRVDQIRSFTPFVGILDQELRNRIFERYKMTT
jgi:hypothetical protein